jgi:hypothetical protein
VVREVLPVNGQLEKHRWSHQPTKKQVVDIEDNGRKKEEEKGRP